MSEFIEVKPENFEQSTFKLIGKDWMLITAEKEGKANSMTASWGGLGVMWDKSVAYIVIRPQRYTKEFIDNTEKFSLAFFDNNYRSMLTEFGAVSGRDKDKIGNAKLTIIRDGGIPFFEEASKVFLCRKLYVQDYKKECFYAKDLIEKWYPEEDFHTLYIAEIIKILIKEH